MAHEIDVAARKVVQALTDKGRSPRYHDAALVRLARQWPVLYRALGELTAAVRRSDAESRSD